MKVENRDQPSARKWGSGIYLDYIAYYGNVKSLKNGRFALNAPEKPMLSRSITIDIFWQKGYDNASLYTCIFAKEYSSSRRFYLQLRTESRLLARQDKGLACVHYRPGSCASVALFRGKSLNR